VTDDRDLGGKTRDTGRSLRGSDLGDGFVVAGILRRAKGARLRMTMLLDDNASDNSRVMTGSEARLGGASSLVCFCPERLLSREVFCPD
jgi:hypothetical protein